MNFQKDSKFFRDAHLTPSFYALLIGVMALFSAASSVAEKSSFDCDVSPVGFGDFVFYPIELKVTHRGDEGEETILHRLTLDSCDERYGWSSETPMGALAAPPILREDGYWELAVVASWYNMGSHQILQVGYDTEGNPYANRTAFMEHWRFEVSADFGDLEQLAPGLLSVEPGYSWLVYDPYLGLLLSDFHGVSMAGIFYTPYVIEPKDNGGFDVSLVMNDAMRAELDERYQRLAELHEDAPEEWGKTSDRILYYFMVYDVMTSNVERLTQRFRWLRERGLDLVSRTDDLAGEPDESGIAPELKETICEAMRLAMDLAPGTSFGECNATE